jgi:hypothetical protein
MAFSTAYRSRSSESHARRRKPSKGVKPSEALLRGTRGALFIGRRAAIEKPRPLVMMSLSANQSSSFDSAFQQVK